MYITKNKKIKDSLLYDKIYLHHIYNKKIENDYLSFIRIVSDKLVYTEEYYHIASSYNEYNSIIKNNEYINLVDINSINKTFTVKTIKVNDIKNVIKRIYSDYLLKIDDVK